MTTTSTTRPSRKDLLIRLSRLLALLLVLPAFLTALHLMFLMQKNGILLVDSPPSVLVSSSSSSSSSLASSNNISPAGKAAAAPALLSLNNIPSGIYWSSSPLQDMQGIYYWRQEENSNRHKFFGYLPGWPSISQLFGSLLRNNDGDYDERSGKIKLEYIQKYESYCFKTNEYTLCPTDDNDDTTSSSRMEPPGSRDGKPTSWKIVEGRKQIQNPNRTIQLRIRSYGWFKPYYFQHDEKPFQQLFQRPATCFLLGLNIGLAFVYWNYRISPNSVSIMDGPIIQQFQYWRALTGTLAHFEWWHLLFNMMSLHNLGQFLEEQYYGSIGFLLYNLALIPLTVLIFIGGNQLVYMGRIKLRTTAAANAAANPNNATTSSSMSPPPPPPPSVNAVGYSGVLFAWMVVSSLEQTKSCPIPFLNDVCFDTWYVTKTLKFNVGPLIQLVVAQIILPRVSFGGHLAGIIAGFLLHWNMLPLELVQPAVSTPLLLLLLLWKHRQLIPVTASSAESGKTTGTITGSSGGRNFLDEAGIDDDDHHHHQMEVKLSPSANSISSSSSSLLCRYPPSGATMGTMHNLLRTLVTTMVIGLAGSFIIMAWGSSLIFAQTALIIMFYYCYQSYIDHWDHDGEQDSWSPGATQKKQRMLVLWKCFIVSCVLVLVLEAMTLASWTVIGPAMVSHYSRHWLALGLLVALVTLHLIAMSVACLHWEGIGGEQEEKGIFEYALGFCVLDNAKVVGHNVVSLWTSGKRLKGKGGLSSSQSGKRSAKNMAAAAAAERRARALQESDIV